MKKISNKVYDGSNEETILREINKLRPLKYNKFQWWRKFTSSTRPLDEKAPLLDKIKNGDLEFSNYFWQARYIELLLNEKREAARDGMEWFTDTIMDRVRRKRLWEDFEKDEAKKLLTIRKAFVKTFNMTHSDYEEQLEKIDGTLEDLYYRCDKLFRVKTKKTRAVKVKKR
tara:strand:- start:250 stop:762 length:513 start_codon:yes stop_codon:yes gene_type:complete